MTLTISEIYEMVICNIEMGGSNFNDDVIIDHDFNNVNMKFYDGDDVVCTMHIERTIHGLGIAPSFTATIEGDTSFIKLETIKNGI